jgi:predicted ester cyclase
MTTPTANPAHELTELATRLVASCFDPPRPDAFAGFCSDERACYLFTTIAEAFPDARFQVTWVVADSGRVAIGGRLDGTHLGPWRGVPATGRRFDIAGVVLLEVVGGTVVAMRTVTDSLAMAEQLAAVQPLEPPACRRYDAAH